MRVTVTGAAGFLGKHLVPELTRAGHQVDAFDRRDGDLADPGQASYLIQRSSPDVVVHLAAQVGRQFGEIDPVFTISSNATVTALVARATIDVGARLVYLSSSEVYGDKGTDDVTESTQPSLPYNLYGLTKRWGEEVSTLYDSNVTVVRLAMPFGPGLPPGKGRAAIVNFLAAAHHGKTIEVHRDSERCWCWVGDSVRGIRMVIESGQTGIFNLGRDDNPTSMLDVAVLAGKVTGNPARIVEIDPPANQVLVKRLNTTKLRSLGWRPFVELEEGMQRTYEAMIKLEQL